LIICTVPANIHNHQRKVIGKSKVRGVSNTKFLSEIIKSNESKLEFAEG